mmetsp:Transcript_27271/g.20415  ORF Transcript_27271/g.20415 Transcript_27271/m.20415 type:complete len:117 (+) Transcript_27271:426-776(+)
MRMGTKFFKTYSKNMSGKGSKRDDAEEMKLDGPAKKYIVQSDEEGPELELRSSFTSSESDEDNADGEEVDEENAHNSPFKSNIKSFDKKPTVNKPGSFQQQAGLLPRQSERFFETP